MTDNDSTILDSLLPVDDASMSDEEAEYHNAIHEDVCTRPQDLLEFPECCDWLAKNH